MEALCYEIIGGPHLMYTKSLTEKNKKDTLFSYCLTLHYILQVWKMDYTGLFINQMSGILWHE